MVTVERGVRSVASRGTLTLTPFSPAGAPLVLQLLAATVLDPGGPTWSELERPRRQTVLEWQGRAPARQTAKVMFSGAYDATVDDLASVTPAVSALHNLAMPPSGGAPPLLHIAGPVYGNTTNYMWRVETITPGEPRRNRDGEVCQVQYDLGLVQHLATDVVSVLTAKSPAAAAAVAIGAPAPSQAKTYTVVKGDTLSRIAQRTLGSAAKWQALATLNGIRDPNSLKVGQVLKLP